MTGSSVVFDAWAWWEILHDTPRGRRLWTRYGRGKAAIHTSSLAVAEIASKVARAGAQSNVDEYVSAVEGRSKVHDVDVDGARAGGKLHADLRHHNGAVSLADAIILALARRLGHTLISADEAFSGLADVRAD